MFFFSWNQAVKHVNKVPRAGRVVLFMISIGTLEYLGVMKICKVACGNSRGKFSPESRFRILVKTGRPD